MRAILHAKFGDQLAKPPCTSKGLPCTTSSQLRASSAEDFESAMTKAQAAWRASKGRIRTATCNAHIARHR